jgi:hypothetical protein
MISGISGVYQPTTLCLNIDSNQHHYFHIDYMDMIHCLAPSWPPATAEPAQY